MDKKMIIGKLLKAYQAKGSSFLEAGAGAAWMFQAPTFQADMNKAITAWVQDDDPEPIKGVVMAMQTYGVLSPDDADTFLQNIEDAKE
jgi:hypothetical protein